MNYLLKSPQHYNNLYDKFTVEECRDFIKYMIQEEASKDKPGERKVRTNTYEFYVSFIMIERALKKDETINKRLEDDNKEEKYINSVKIPKATCNVCGKLMDLEDKMIMGGIGENKKRVLFTFSCGNCNKRRAIYNDGEEIISKKHLCPKCNIELDKKSNINDDIVKIDYFCNKCDYKETEEFDLSVEKEKPDPNYEDDRKKFCISEDEAYKLQQGIENFYIDINNIITGKDPKSIAKKEEEKKYSPLKKIKIITHKELEDKLSKILSKEGYKDFNLAKPEVGDDIRVYFSVFDSNGESNTVKSNTKLRKLIKDFLIKTNWELIDSGKFENRLGVIKGKLKGVDNRDKLLELISKRQSQKKKK